MSIWSKPFVLIYVIFCLFGSITTLAEKKASRFSSANEPDSTLCWQALDRAIHEYLGVNVPTVPQIVTLGPGTAYQEEIIDAYIRGIFRLNFSHNQVDDKKRLQETNDIIKTVANMKTALLGDLGGPKIRTAYNNESLYIHAPMKLVFTRGDAEPQVDHHKQLARVKVPPETFDWITENLKPNDPIELADAQVVGLVEELVPGSEFSMLVTEAKKDFVLEQNKGINAPHTNINAPALTPKDYGDVDYMLWMGTFQHITISFGSSGNDVRQLRDYMDNVLEKIFPAIAKAESWQNLIQNIGSDQIGRVHDFAKNALERSLQFDEQDWEKNFKILKYKIINNNYLRPKIWFKVETRTALRNIIDIVGESDGVIIARGDLTSQVKRRLVAARNLTMWVAQKMGKPVFIATGSFYTPYQQKSLSPANASDPSDIAGLDAGVWSSEESALAVDPDSLLHLLRSMLEVAVLSWDHGHFFDTRPRLRNSNQEPKIPKKYLPTKENRKRAKKLIQLTEEGVNNRVGEVPIVLIGAVDSDLLHALRRRNPRTPLLIVLDEAQPNVKNYAKSFSGFSYLRTVIMNFHEKSFKDIALEASQIIGWINVGDEIVADSGLTIENNQPGPKLIKFKD